jgi:hypothetical protein
VITSHPDQFDALKERMGVTLNALGDRDPTLAAYVAGLLDGGQFRICARFAVDANGEIDAYSLCYQVEVPVGGQTWVPFCAPHWSELGLNEDHVLAELADVRAQHEGDPAA